MENMELIELLGQAKTEDVSNVLNDFLRATARYAVIEAMNEELTMLCGPRYAPKETSTAKRGGSATGTIFLGTHSESIKRPRIRQHNADGTTSEQTLQTYEAARNGTTLKAAMMKALIAGVPSRKQCELNDAKGTSRSAVSRLWHEKAREFIELLRSRQLCKDGYVALMVDGIHLSSDITAVVALGISPEGQKQMLDFEVGSSENNEICETLIDRLVERGFKPAAKHLLCVLDGGKALRHGVRKHWPDARIQTCLIHVCRRIKARLAKKHYKELEARFKQLRKAADLDAAQEAYKRLETFVGRHSAEGLNTLHAAKTEMLTLHSLGVPDTMNKTLLSTNCIENSIRNMRGVIGRVTRWRSNTDMPAKWLACAMLEAEKGFQRINGYQHISQLIDALNLAPPPGEEGKAITENNR